MLVSIIGITDRNVECDNRWGLSILFQNA